LIDIHAHILPGVDDGPVSWDQSIDLVKQAAEDGIRGIVCTSHVLDDLSQELEDQFISKFGELKQRVIDCGLNVSLWLGSEIHIHSVFDIKSKIATINGNGKYLLIELPLSGMANNAGETFFNLTVNGITPILAHPERNRIIIYRPEVAFEFVNMGVLIQLNAGSITGAFGRSVKRCSFKLLDHRLVHFVASDCHHPKSRPLMLSKAFRVVARRWGMEMAEILFRKNPLKAVNGEDPIVPAPVPFDKKIIK